MHAGLLSEFQVLREAPCGWRLHCSPGLQQKAPGWRGPLDSVPSVKAAYSRGEAYPESRSLLTARTVNESLPHFHIACTLLEQVRLSRTFPKSGPSFVLIRGACSVNLFVKRQLFL